MDVRQIPNNEFFAEFMRRMRCAELPERRVVIVGPPGAGKGSVAPRLTEKYCLCHLATGDMLRAAVSAGTELGKQAKDVMARGELVSDELIIGLIQDNMTRPDCTRGMLLDGFPRTLVQAKKLDEILGQDGQKITGVVNLQVPDELLVERICGRRIHKPSGRSYHLKFKPPQVEGKDDVTGEPLIQRKDDNEDSLKTRLKAFYGQTLPIVDYYSKTGLVNNVDASQTFDQVWRDVQSSLD